MFRFSVLVLALIALPAHAQIFPGLTGEELWDALAATYVPSAVLSEAASKDTLYAVIDRVTVGGQDGTVGLYTGFFVPFDCVPSCDPSQDVFNNEAGINQEHTWPRSEGADSGNAERDLHHLFPTRVAVNSARASLPFGESPDEQTTAWYVLDQAQATPPAEDDRDAWSELLADVRFEPREEKKGDVARALFYFYTMYGPSGTGQASTAFFEGMKETLLAWHEADLPTAEEIARSERVAEYQATGSGETAINPFVHDATLVRRAFFASPVVFVRAAAEPDEALQTGTTWATAHADLQAALALKDRYAFIEEVWVAEGAYCPGPLASHSFELRNGLAVYGGFNGSETSLDMRDPDAHETVLQGENCPTNGGSTFTIVEAYGVDETAVLDGITIEGGVGGLAVVDATPVVRHTTFRANKRQGAAVSQAGAYPRFVDVTFEENGWLLEPQSGSAIGVENGASLVVLGGRFIRNGLRAGRQGDVTGGTVFVNDFDDPPPGERATVTLINVYFAGNRGVHGNAISAFRGVDLTVVNGVFVGHEPTWYDPYNCMVICAGTTGATLVNITVTASRGASEANSIAVGLNPEGGMITNSMFWGNDVVNELRYGLAVSHSLVEGGYAGGTNILDADPLFVRPPHPGLDGEWGTEDDDYGDLRLVAGNPAIDFGLTDYLPPDTFDLDGDGNTTEPLPLDLAGEPRVQGSGVDLGAYEGSLPVSGDPAAGLPLRDDLAAPYPNPARTQATLVLSLASPRESVIVEAFDVLGRRVAVLHEGPLAAGTYRLAFDGTGFPAGVYVVRSTAAYLHETQRVVIVH